MTPQERREGGPSLHELQALLQAAILNGDDKILSFVSGNSRTDAATLFSVYRNAYRGRLLEILANDFPLCRRFVGDDEFERIALDFINAHPSRTQNARWFGAGFPEYAARMATIEASAVSELAAIEKALADAFDSGDGTVIGLDELVQIPPEDWSRLTFKPHVTSAELIVRTNAFDIWLALKDDAEPPEARRLPEDGRLLIWRQGNRPMIRPMPYEEAMIWVESAKGVPFSGLCELMATFDDPENAALRAAGYLQGWLVSGVLGSVSVQQSRPAAARGMGVP